MFGKKTDLGKVYTEQNDPLLFTFVEMCPESYNVN
jgi:hypothetical protein